MIVPGSPPREAPTRRVATSPAPLTSLESAAQPCEPGLLPFGVPAGIDLLHTPELPDVLDYACAATVDPGTRLVLTAGACPLARDGTVVAPGDVAAQAHQVMRNLRVALEAAGAGLADVVRTTVYVASAERSDLVAAWTVVRDAFGADVPPGTLLGVAGLGYAEQLVEVDAVAAVRAR